MVKEKGKASQKIVIRFIPNDENFIFKQKEAIEFSSVLVFEACKPNQGESSLGSLLLAAG